ncbi:Cof-type HAD-IIB family hydrolase [Lederbergia lenta]|uniref:HAD family hydrolase n=1 Tax=Lederbergia lenta TaxID=1467 RepID=A0A2X4W5L0_LEDLE|nr:Cof-type HAD-IIB family hydrolase [Lederbergia lenta]MCM3109826.1 Cof-type HAD-IIB family hydrolase [Lederbergia lenta]MEC2324424.1 Cof-type HAD-IIB family hydrolase [Lederbergia lenta]SQI59937.1 HAD family hydrolase [Lederbergia lenta]
MSYKLLALDVDGTLLNDDGVLTQKTIDTIKKVYNSGIQVVISTGRSLNQTRPILDELGIEGILVSHNGATTLRTDNKEIIHEFSYDIKEVADIVRYCRKHDIQFSVCTAFDFYVERLDNYQTDLYKRFNLVPIMHSDVLSLTDKVMKFTVDDQQRVDGWRDIKFSNLRKTSDSFFQDIIHPNAHKASALEQVLYKLNMDKSEIIAIGDFYNDLEMLEFAGLGIAMGNAPDDLKEKADVVTTSNNEDGVSHALEKYLF